MKIEDLYEPVVVKSKRGFDHTMKKLKIEGNLGTYPPELENIIAKNNDFSDYFVEIANGYKLKAYFGRIDRDAPEDLWPRNDIQLLMLFEVLLNLKNYCNDWGLPKKGDWIDCSDTFPILCLNIDLPFKEIQITFADTGSFV